MMRSRWIEREKSISTSFNWVPTISDQPAFFLSSKFWQVVVLVIQNIIFAALFIHTAHYIGSVVPASCIMVPSVGEGSLCCMDMKIPHKIDGTLQGEAIRFWIAQLIYSLALQQSQCMHTTLESLTFPRPHFLSIRPLSLSRSTHTHTHHDGSVVSIEATFGADRPNRGCDRISDRSRRDSRNCPKIIFTIIHRTLETSNNRMMNRELLRFVLIP